MAITIFAFVIYSIVHVWLAQASRPAATFFTLADTVMTGASTVTVAAVNVTETLSDLVVAAALGSRSIVSDSHSGVDIVGVELHHGAEPVAGERAEDLATLIHEEARRLPPLLRDDALAMLRRMTTSSVDQWISERARDADGEFALVEVAICRKPRGIELAYI